MLLFLLIGCVSATLDGILYINLPAAKQRRRAFKQTWKSEWKTIWVAESKNPTFGPQENFWPRYTFKMRWISSFDSAMWWNPLISAKGRSQGLKNFGDRKNWRRTGVSNSKQILFNCLFNCLYLLGRRGHDIYSRHNITVIMVTMRIPNTPAVIMP